ncbi:MAG: hypothetical protein K2N89_10195 [Lachnospiraceae bacterium]|nr:hypothetical protein [Lachnospiraceae bacterium]
MKQTRLRIFILVISALFIGIGIAKQEYLEVMQKAVRVCLECIGIG